MKVSIAMCTYNGALFLDEQLNSFLIQKRLPDELVICDDLSTDHSLPILNNFKAIAPFPVIIKRNSERFGVRKNFEQAIEMTTGDIVFLADQDDIWFEDKISFYLERFDSDPHALLIFSDGILMDEKSQDIGGTLWQKWGFDEKKRTEWQNNRHAFQELFHNINKVTGATVAIRSALKEKALPIYTLSSHWHDAWLALIASGMEGLRFIDLSLIRYRVHPGQQVGLGARPNPFKHEIENFGPAKSRLWQLYFEKRVSDLFPGNEKLFRRDLEEEISFLEREILPKTRLIKKMKRLILAAIFKRSK